MTFKTGDRVIVNNDNWDNAHGTVVSEKSEWGEDRFAVRMDGFGSYMSETDYHPIHKDYVRHEGDSGDAIKPNHYQFPGGVQVIDLTRHLGFLEGNVVKYVARAGRKGAAKEDLLKARQYLDWLIEDTDA